MADLQFSTPKLAPVMLPYQKPRFLPQIPEDAEVFFKFIHVVGNCHGTPDSLDERDFITQRIKKSFGYLYNADIKVDFERHPFETQLHSDEQVLVLKY